MVSVRHVGAHPDELQHGVSIQSSINLGKTFLRISRIRIIPSTQIFARVFVYLPPFISKILDFICRMVLIFTLIYFEWRDTENQQLVSDSPVMVLHSLVLVFTQSSFIFLHSPVLIFTQSSFNFYTVQFYFFTQSSFNIYTV